MIETLDDIIEQIADQQGVYGSHQEDCDPPLNCCRVCWTSQLKERIREAIKIEEKLKEPDHARS